MIKTTALAGIITLIVMSSPQSLANTASKIETMISPAENWVISKQDKTHQITSYIKMEDNQPVRSFRVDSTLNTGIDDVIRIHKDVDNLKKWFWGTRKAVLIKEVSESEFYYYTVFKAPLVPDRDAVMLARIIPQPDNRDVRILQLNSVDDVQYSGDKGMVRVANINISIKMTGQGLSKTKIEAIGQFDPGGNIPLWVANHIQSRAPYLTMLGLQRMIETSGKK
ncbi:MAG: START domain-containing protein [Fluviicoccus sp.]|uniref:START domain-containing protein n=1 Tax=Fluviicoccus sp. TaxID=2003552 RepID=UPI00271DAF8E|nr:START domain-containing protein [Fluviicoccus sp.]MDO8329607.1 START domain-containing protein [Fluviicoccus sp.]